jgi:hypothetical protein
MPWIDPVPERSKCVNSFDRPLHSTSLQVSSMGLNRNVLMIALALTLACLVLVAVFVWETGVANRRLHQDEKLIAIFHDNHQAFEKLQQMAIEDSRQGRYFSKIYLEQSREEGSKIDESRLREYKNVISRIRPGLNWQIDGRNNVVRFIFAQGGLLAVGPGWIEGIEYIPGDYRRNGVVLTNLDKASTSPAGIYLRPIETNWFLFYQRE